MYHKRVAIGQKLVSKRINVTLPDSAYQKLDSWAEAEARPTSNLASYLLQKILEDAEEKGKIPQKKSKEGDRS